MLPAYCLTRYTIYEVVASMKHRFSQNMNSQDLTVDAHTDA